VVSPYFVPQASGIEWFAQLRERGVKVRVITNSLAANNHSVVHSGYAPSRRALLDMGVELYEVRPDAGITGLERVGNESSRATLHTKAFIIDRRRLFVGSFNWDPRSFYINTEMGVILENPDLAQRLIDSLDAVLAERTYRVDTNEQGALRWHAWEDGQDVVYYSEPATSCWKRFITGLMSWLPIKGQL
jgi:putative cardiolipin synthase